ncbi:hypothetical protein MC28_1484 [Bacillus thuringiensis MC28]|nr:hypothetical protein MC28_1484 [Bacillus thuringiensis MC28]
MIYRLIIPLIEDWYSMYPKTFFYHYTIVSFLEKVSIIYIF